MYSAACVLFFIHFSKIQYLYLYIHANDPSITRPPTWAYMWIKGQIVKGINTVYVILYLSTRAILQYRR
jgi:hypothetical protein